MISVLKTKVDGTTAYAELKINSACCKTVITIVGHFDGKLYTDFINADTGSPIYVGIYPLLIEAFKKGNNEKVN